MAVKQSTISNIDWTYISLNAFNFIATSDSNELTSNLLDMRVGDLIGTEIASERDGLFDEEQLFMVYSQDDVKKLIELLSQSLNTDAQNIK